MADTKARIIMEAVDNASKVINGVNDSIEKSGDRFKNFADQIPGLNQGLALMINPVTLAGAGIAAAGKFASDATRETLDYNKSIRELSTNLNMSTEETSRLVQTADDFTVSQEALTSSLERALKNGYAPSVEIMAQLADKYKSIQDPVKRAAELTKVFGENWSQLTPMLEAGGDAIREAAAGQSDSLIVTEKASQATRDYEIAMDALNDAISGVKYSVGNALIPPLTAAVKWAQQGKSAAMQLSEAYKSGALPLEKYSDIINDLGNGLITEQQAIDMLNEIQKEYIAQLRQTDDLEEIRSDRMRKDLIPDLEKMGNITEKLTKQVHGYSQSFEEVALKINSEYIRKIESAIAQVPTTLNMNLSLGSSIGQMIDEIDFKNAGGGKIQQAFEDVKRLWLVDHAITEDEAKGYFKSLQAGYYTTMVEAKQMTKDEAAKGLADDLGITYWEAWKMIGQPIQDVLDSINKDIKLNVEAHVFVTGDTWVKDVIMNTPKGKTGAPMPEARAGGGDVTAGDPYIVGENGPELFVPQQSGAIVPNDALKGGSNQINIYFQGPVGSQAEARAGANQGVLAALRAAGRA